MYYREHAPPTPSEVRWAESGLRITDLRLIEGGLPRSRLLVLEWAFQHRDELGRTAERASEDLAKIEPLD